MYTKHTFRAFLIYSFLLHMVFGCSQPESTETMQTVNATPKCTNCPTLVPGQDTLAYVIGVMRFFAETADVGLLDNQVLTNVLSVGLDSIDVDRVIEIFRNDSAAALCSQVASTMVKTLIDNGIDAYTFNFGFEDIRLSHVLVLAKVKGRLFIFDPIQNYTLLGEDGKPIDILTVIDQIGRNDLRVRPSEDTVLAEVICDLRKLPGKRMLDSYAKDPACLKYWSEVELVRDSVVKRKFNRCFSCDIGPCAEKNLKYIFVDTLKARTRLTQYHEGLVVNARVMAGSQDAQQVDDLIQTAIYSQPNLGKRVNSTTR